MLVETPAARDYNLPPSFISSCKNTTLPIAVVGNSSSIQELTSRQVRNINRSRLLRCNWSFKDPSKIKKEYTIYFSQAYGAAMDVPDHSESNLVNQLDSAIDNNELLIYRYILNPVVQKHRGWTFKSSGGYAVWPTTGIQMLIYACMSMEFQDIIITGIDMYTYNRPSGDLTPEQVKEYLKTKGRTFSESPDDSAGLTMYKENITYIAPAEWESLVNKFKMTSHFVDVDLMQTMYCLAYLHIHKKNVSIYNSPTLELINQYVVNNIETVQQYFDRTRSSLSSTETIQASYNIWKLINMIVSKINNK